MNRLVSWPALWLFAAVLCIAGFYVWRDATAPMTESQREQHVEALIQRQQWSEAETFLRAWLQEKESSPQLTCVLADVLMQQHKPEEAIAVLTPIHNTRRRADVNQWLGEAHRRLGQRDLAIERFKEALELEPKRSGAAQSLATLYLDAGRNDEAGEVLRDHPEFESLQIRLALRLSDIAVLSTSLDPLDAQTVAGLMAMARGDVEALKRTLGNTSSTPWSQLARFWIAEPDAAIADRLVEAALDRLDDPLLSETPAPLDANPLDRLTVVAQTRWRSAHDWPAVSSSVDASPRSEAEVLAVVFSQTADRHWDAALHEVFTRSGAKVALEVLQQTRRDDALAETWRARLHLELGELAAARSCIETAAKEYAHAPRVMRIMVDLTARQLASGGVGGGEGLE